MLIRSVRGAKILMLISITLFITVLCFCTGLGIFMSTTVRAEAVTWVGGANFDWCTPANWSKDPVALPTSADNVTVSAGASLNITTSDCGAGQVNFSTLTIGDGININTIVFSDSVIGTGGSIIIKNAASLIQVGNAQHTISGRLTIESGGLLTHSQNTEGNGAYSVNFSVGELDVQSGGSINVDGRGHEGGLASSNGYGGAGAGTFDSSSADGSGGANAGGGGMESGGVAGGSSTCDITNPAVLGSGGGGAVLAAGGDGGGLIILNVSGTATTTGVISADGLSGSSGGSNRDSGGGGGGSIKITAGAIVGTPESFTATGGDSGTDGVGYEGGGGGGGCVFLQYTNSVSVSPISVAKNGGIGNQYGGAGVLTIRKSDGSDTDVYSVNNGISGAETTQVAGSVTANTLTVRGGAIYTVSSTNALILSDSNPLILSDNISVLRIAGNSVFTPNTTFTIASTTLELYQTATLTNASNWDVTIGNNATTSLYYFTTSSPWTINSLTIQSGGKLTHAANTSAQTHVVNVSATTISVQSGGSINVDSKGYAGGGTSADGSGPGKGLYEST